MSFVVLVCTLALFSLPYLNPVTINRWNRGSDGMATGKLASHMK
jgi:hypothetical protein